MNLTKMNNQDSRKHYSTYNVHTFYLGVTTLTFIIIILKAHKIYHFIANMSSNQIEGAKCARENINYVNKLRKITRSMVARSDIIM